MAQIVGCAEMYDAFYGHASSFLHIESNGAWLCWIDGTTLEIQPGPIARHIGVAMRIGDLNLFTIPFLNTQKLVGADHSEVLKRIDGLIGGAIETEGSVLGCAIRRILSLTTISPRKPTYPISRLRSDA